MSMYYEYDECGVRVHFPINWTCQRIPDRSLFNQKVGYTPLVVWRDGPPLKLSSQDEQASSSESAETEPHKKHQPPKDLNEQPSYTIELYTEMLETKSITLREQCTNNLRRTIATKHFLIDINGERELKNIKIGDKCDGATFASQSAFHYFYTVDSNPLTPKPFRALPRRRTYIVGTVRPETGMAYILKVYTFSKFKRFDEYIEQKIKPLAATIEFYECCPSPPPSEIAKKIASQQTRQLRHAATPTEPDEEGKSPTEELDNKQFDIDDRYRLQRMNETLSASRRGTLVFKDKNSGVRLDLPNIPMSAELKPVPTYFVEKPSAPLPPECAYTLLFLLVKMYVAIPKADPLDEVDVTQHIKQDDPFLYIDGNTLDDMCEMQVEVEVEDIKRSGVQTLLTINDYTGIKLKRRSECALYTNWNNTRYIPTKMGGRTGQSFVYTCKAHNPSWTDSTSVKAQSVVTICNCKGFIITYVANMEYGDYDTCLLWFHQLLQNVKFLPSEAATAAFSKNNAECIVITEEMVKANFPGPSLQHADRQEQYCKVMQLSAEKLNPDDKLITVNSTGVCSSSTPPLSASPSDDLLVDVSGIQHVEYRDVYSLPAEQDMFTSTPEPNNGQPGEDDSKDKQGEDEAEGSNTNDKATPQPESPPPSARIAIPPQGPEPIPKAASPPPTGSPTAALSSAAPAPLDGNDPTHDDTQQQQNSATNNASDEDASNEMAKLLAHLEEKEDDETRQKVIQRVFAYSDQLVQQHREVPEWSLRDLYMKQCERLNCKPNSNFIDKLPTDPQHNIAIEELDLSLNYFGNRGLLAVLVLCNEMPNLRTLVLKEMSLDNTDVKNIVDVVIGHSVTSLDMSNNPKISLLSTKQLLKLPRENANIIHLSLKGTKLGTEVLEKLNQIVAINYERKIQHMSSMGASLGKKK